MPDGSFGLIRKVVSVAKNGQHVTTRNMKSGAAITVFMPTFDVPLANVRDWERSFHEFMGAKYPQVGDGIRTGKTLTKEIEADLKRGIEDFKKTFSVAKPAGITNPIR